jgi:transmembrane 9 superfamily protein 2/4
MTVFVGCAAQVNSLTSFETELPYEYYTMPFCQPPEGIKKMSTTANLGTILMGLRIENSPYNFTMMVRSCRWRCSVCESAS